MVRAVQYALNALTGFAIGSSIISGPSFLQCTGYINSYGEKLLKIYGMYEVEWNSWGKTLEFEKFRIWPQLMINDELIWLMYNWHDFSNGCFYGAFENYENLIYYWNWINDPVLILWNTM